MPTAVLKKQSPSGRLTVYLSGRELVVEGGGTRPIDGVVLVEPREEEDRRAYALLVLTFRYGREDEEVMGLKFYTEAVLQYTQIFPPSTPEEEEEALTPLQQHLLKKLGPDAHPLTVRVSTQAPHSVRLQPARAYHGGPLGVTYDLKVFLGSRPDEKPSRRNMVRLSLRCVHRNPELPLPPPRATVSRSFVFSAGKLRLEAVLDRAAYRHDEPLHVHVTLDNDCGRTVRGVRVTLLQHVHVCMFTNGRFKNVVGSTETEPNHPVLPGTCLSRDFCLRPAPLPGFPVALAVEGGLAEGSASRLSPTTSSTGDGNPYGVSVSYEVKVKALLGYVHRPVTLRIPFKMLGEPPVETEQPVVEEGLVLFAT